MITGWEDEDEEVSSYWIILWEWEDNMKMAFCGEFAVEKAVGMS